MDASAMEAILRNLIQGIELLDEAMQIALLQYQEEAAEEKVKLTEGSEIYERE